MEKTNHKGFYIGGCDQPNSPYLSAEKYFYVQLYSDGFKWDKVLNSIQGIRACIGY